ncbi:hypothetical protein, partial [Streptomyces sanglieri]|uniref:hypothetical protein n=1 Tax=Streptomyces sanglieri TaxID=193460 RepID=UPI00352416CC
MLARELFEALGPDDLLMADRGFAGLEQWRAASAGEAPVGHQQVIRSEGFEQLPREHGLRGGERPQSCVGGGAGRVRHTR